MLTGAHLEQKMIDFEKLKDKKSELQFTSISKEKRTD